MANLKEVRTRIVSVKSTQQITNAMKMVAAAKLRKAQNAIIQLRPYAGKLSEILDGLMASLEGSHLNGLATPREVKKVLLIPISSNRGLCGSFNANVIKACRQLAESTYPKQWAQGQVDVLSVGKKARETLQRQGFQLVENHDYLFDELTFNQVAKLAEKLIELYQNGTYDCIQVVYHRFKNAAVQQLTVETFLPVQLNQTDAENQGFQTEFLFEPDRDELVNSLIPKSLKIQFYKMLLDSNASEHGARMTAMHQATDNAAELLKNLQLSYNKARQAAITSEILEIVGGAEALHG